MQRTHSSIPTTGLYQILHFPPIVARNRVRPDLQVPSTRSLSLIYRVINEHYYFSARPSLQELCEFYEEAVNIAAKFLFNANTDDNYHRCIAGLYTIYSIHQKDSTSKKACVRVVSSSSKILQEMQVYARENGHLDLLYVLCSMLRDGVFRFVATSRDYGLEFSFWKYIDSVYIYIIYIAVFRRVNRNSNVSVILFFVFRRFIGEKWQTSPQ